MIIDGIASSEHLDSSGEILKISGHDISDLVEGRGVLNFEHNNDSPADIVGAITFAKKIMKKTDCSNDRELLYWDSCGTSFVYIKAELFDDEEHPGAIAAAAMIRYYHKRELKILAGFSIEGSTLERDDNILERSVGRRVALTLRPCNKSAISGVYTDAKQNFSVDDSVKKFMDMSNNPRIKTVEVDALVFDDIEKSDLSPMEDLKKAISDLNKTLTAGGYNVAPSQLTGGSALMVEDKKKKLNHGLSDDLKERLKRAVSTWDKKRPLKEVIRDEMPEVSDEYIDHFTELAEEISLKKGVKPPTRIGSHHSWNVRMNDDQRRLIEGLYLDDAKPFGGLGDQSDPETKRLKNDDGQDVVVQTTSAFDDSDHDPAKAASAYYKLASDYFGLGDHVPVTNYFSHSSMGDTHQNMQAMEYQTGSHTPYDSTWASTVKNGRNDGSAHKLAIMDMILGGDQDRHYGSMLSRHGKIINIDNGSALEYNGNTADYPSHFEDFQDVLGQVEEGMGGDLMHIDAVTWLSRLNARDLVTQMNHAGIDKSKIKEALSRLKLIQSQASGKSLGQLHDLIYPKRKVVAE